MHLFLIKQKIIKQKQMWSLPLLSLQPSGKDRHLRRLPSGREAWELRVIRVHQAKRKEEWFKPRKHSTFEEQKTTSVTGIQKIKGRELEAFTGGQTI